MKKDYVSPAIKIYEVVMQGFIAVSGINVEKTSIPYGGVDTEGTNEPSSRSFDMWDTE